MKKLTHITAVIFGLFILSTGDLQAKEINFEPNIVKGEVDECKVKGLFYTVQLGVYSKPVSDEAFPTIAKPIYCIKRADGLYAHFAGIFDSRFDAMEKRFDVVSKGLYEAYVACYFNSEQISMPKADELIAEHGTDILFNSEKQEDNFTQKPE